ncbi:helix-turn-helix domain-containing protein [Actinomycetes bacterium KLBMP 9797]
MGLGKDYERQECTLARALEVVGERWTMLVVRDAFYGVRRFSDFRAHLDIPRAVLADRLATLTAAGILAKQRYRETPPRDEYVLTERGRELWSVVYPLMQWGDRHLANAGTMRIFEHTPCGARLDQTGGCPDCGRLVPPDEVTIRPGPGEALRKRDDPVTVALRRPHPLLEPLLP